VYIVQLRLPTPAIDTTLRVAAWVLNMHRYWFDTGVPLVAELQSQTDSATIGSRR